MHEESHDAFLRSKKVTVHACIKKDEKIRSNYQLASELYKRGTDKSLKIDIELRKDLLAKSGALLRQAVLRLREKRH